MKLAYVHKCFFYQLRKLPTSIAKTVQLTRGVVAPSNAFLSTENEEDTYINMLNTCSRTSNLHKGKAIYATAMKKGFLQSLYLSNHLINMYVKCGDLDNGLQLFEEIPHKNVVSWTALIAGFVQMGFPMEALSLFSHMHGEGIKPNEFTFVSTLQACSLTNGFSHVYQIYALIVRLGFVSNVFLVNAFLTALIRQDKLHEALEVFEECLNRDTVSWNTLMAGYSQFLYSGVPRFCRRMISEGVTPDEFTYSTVLSGLAELFDFETGVQVHARLVKSGHGDDICVGNSLVDMYLKNEHLVEGCRAFEEIGARDVNSWTQMAAGCLSCGEPGKALQVIEEMQKMGVKPNRFTLATAFNACANLAFLEEGRKVHSLRIKLGNEADICVDNALLDMYAKCGDMDCALGVFQSMDLHSVVSWTTMIMGYAQNGHSKEALQIFDEMRLTSVQPNCITFICILNACSQGGFVDEGLKYFSSMTHDYGISPGEDHYACIVNLLGRAGRIKEAEDLILGMPFKPSALIWQTLLGACQLHGDIETAKRATKHALVLDKEDPSTYVLLSNLFAGMSNWEDVGMLRGLMEARDVKKMPGSSWIELNRDHSLLKARKETI